MKEAAIPRTVFMIVAHNHPDLLARLVGRLAAPWAHVLVAIDAKAEQQPFEVALAGLSVTFLPRDLRVDVQWGGIGLTLTARRMMREAAVRWSPDRFCMLSGVDYPAKPIEEIGRALGPEIEWVRVDRRLDPAASNLHDDFIRFPYFNDVRALNPRSSPRPKLQRMAVRALRLFPRRPVQGLELFHGGGWWAITGEAAAWILDFFERRPEVFAWLRNANCPDEIFVQSLLKASPYASRIAQDFTRAAPRETDHNLHGCHYVDWGDGSSSTPKILDARDFAALRSSRALFARKVDPARSAALLDSLDQAAGRGLQEAS